MVKVIRLVPPPPTTRVPFPPSAVLHFGGPISPCTSDLHSAKGGAVETERSD